MSQSKPPAAAEQFADPPRLLSLEGPQRDLLEQANLGFRRGLNERQAWGHVAERLDEPWHARFRWPLGLALAAAAVALFIAFAGSRSTSQVAQQIAPEAHTGPHSKPGPALQPGEALREGATRFSDGSVVRVARSASVALASRDEQHTVLSLTAGSASFSVAPQGADRTFAVVAGGYEFRVIGTAFTVSAETSAVALDVTEGSVEVRRGSEALATVQAGERWSADLDGRAEERAEQSEQSDKAAPPKSTHAPAPDAPQLAPEAPSPVAPAVVEEKDCAALARAAGGREQATACYTEQARGNGLSAEVALYELGRLKRASGDSSGAIAALREHRSRFPQGQLQGEVALTLVEQYGASGQAKLALEESERLLGTQYGRERAEQLHWLRGNLYRESLRDYVRAQTEYEQINPGAKLGAEALYFTAVCLEQRGQRDAARQAYEEYLRHPRASRKPAVERKLEQLSP